MTLERLARMAHDEFVAVREEMATKSGLQKLRDDVYEHFATKVDLEEFRDEIVEAVKKENVKTLQANDKVIAKLDLLLKDKAGHDTLHIRVDDMLLDHEKRIRKAEEKLK